MCYEWNDPLGCLDELCGPLDSYDREKLEYFESLQCRRHYVEHNGDTDSYFDTSENMGKCESVYTHCKNGEAMEEWLEAQQNGECTLTPDSGSASMYQIYGLNILSDIDYDISYADFQTFCPDCRLSGCEATYEMCQELVEFNAKLLARFVAVSEFPLPEDPWMRWGIKDIDIGVKQLAEFISVDKDTGFTQKEAITQLTHIPENLHALSNLLGKDAFFGLFGGKGFEKVFGEAIASHHKTAALQFNFELNDNQNRLLPQLNAYKETREKAESDETQHLLESVAASDAEALFHFMQNIHNTQNISEINILIDELSLAGP